MNERLQYREQFSQRQIETFRTWDNVRKMRCMFEMYELAKHRLRMAVRARHPNWSDYDRTADRVPAARWLYSINKHSFLCSLSCRETKAKGNIH